MKELFFWLICNTSIDNGRQTSNKEIRKAFLNQYPELNNDNGGYAGLIGIFLTGLYHNKLIKTNTGTGNVLYNIKIHSKPLKQITVTELE